MPVLTTEGTPSTRSLASFRPEAGDLADDLDDADLVRAEAGHRDRELGLLFDGRSRGSSRACRRGATATGAAAVTPNFSSIIFTRSTISITVMLEIASRMSSLLGSHCS